MKKTLKFLEDKSSIGANDIMTMSLDDLTILLKINQLETMITFMQMNYPEELGIIHTLEFELKNVLKEQENKEVIDNEDIGF